MRYIPNEELQQITGLERMPGVDVGDAEFVRAAASVPGSILVTTDGPLTTAVRVNGIEQAQGFAIASPSTALLMAGPENGLGS